MTDQGPTRKEITIRTPDHVVSPVHGHLTRADLEKIGIPRDLAETPGKIEIHVHNDHQRSAGDDLLRRMVPYFVIMVGALILFGMIAGILMMLVPPFLALIVTITSSIVALIMSVVSMVVTVGVISIGIQAMVNNSGKIGKGR